MADTEPPAVPFDWQLAKAFALSPRNERSLEDKWYILWNKVFMFFTHGRKDFAVAPQYRFYHDIKDDTDDEKDDEGNPRERELPMIDDDDDGRDAYEFKRAGGPQESSSAVDKNRRGSAPDSSSDDPIDCISQNSDIFYIGRRSVNGGEGSYRDKNCVISSDVSNISAATEPNGYCSEKIPDFAMLHLCACAESDFEDPIGFHGFDIAEIKFTHECCPIFAEIKGAVSRFLQGQHLLRQLNIVFIHESKQVQEQCQHHFLKYERAYEVYVIFAVGSFWKWKLVRWHDVLIEKDEAYFNTIWSAGWSEWMEIGEENSQAALTELSAALKKKLPIILPAH